ncbi:flagellar assembly protein FliW [Scatolibacter rhodanostii]|uniref:flagellar assembly protein FliW n=1 Tax=Scatolibacter rhodanostii TaxID=2014781 RepID=UPI000C07E0EB|nr:flagellar assembly protein FliW [Scatolibacter rhodanostii]
MTCKTRDFGEIEISQNEIIHFVQPLFGFEEYQKFTLIFDPEIGRHIVWLQSIDDPNICFILYDPTPLASFYTPKLPEQIDSLLGEGELVCWTVAVVSNNLDQMHVNLKSPIIINVQKNLGAQIILDQDYPLRFLLTKEAELC